MADSAAKQTMYVQTVTPEQATTFGRLLEERGWQMDRIPYALWRAKHAKTTAVAYASGKLTIQGKETPEVVQFVLEPCVLKEARFGYEKELQIEAHPEMLQPHAGIDESGKGDYFGPLVIAAAYVNDRLARELMDMGVKDSKAFKSDRRVAALAKEIRRVLHGRFAVVAIGPEAYNRLYARFANVNRLLGWGHARALENLLEQQPDCPRALSDQFGKRSTVARALLERGRRIILEQRPKAESDIAVAAASLLARAEFVHRLEKLGETTGIILPKGASAKVRETAEAIVREHGPDRLQGLVKLHFRTTAQVLAASGMDDSAP
jgi:ribonuclease HIII